MGFIDTMFEELERDFQAPSPLQVSTEQNITRSVRAFMQINRILLKFNPLTRQTVRLATQNVEADRRQVIVHNCGLDESMVQLVLVNDEISAKREDEVDLIRSSSYCYTVSDQRIGTAHTTVEKHDGKYRFQPKSVIIYPHAIDQSTSLLVTPQWRPGPLPATDAVRDYQYLLDQRVAAESLASVLASVENCQPELTRLHIDRQVEC